MEIPKIPTRVIKDVVDEYEYMLYRSWVEWFKRNPGLYGYQRFARHMIIQEMTVIRLVKTVLAGKALGVAPPEYHRLGWVVDWHEGWLFRRLWIMGKALGVDLKRGDFPKHLREQMDIVTKIAKEDAVNGLLGLRLALKFHYTGLKAAGYRANNRRVAQLGYLAYLREDEETKQVDDALSSLGLAKPDRAVIKADLFTALLPIFFDFFQAAETADDGGPQLEDPEWERVALMDELRRIRLKLATAGLWREILLVYEPEDDGVYAFENWCTHERDPLIHGYLEGKYLTCLGHHATFDIRTGRVVVHPNHGDARVLPSYQTKVEDDVVYVRVP